MKFLKFCLLTLGLALGPAAAALADHDRSHVLPNGLKVVLSPQPGCPTVSVRLTVKAGSARERGAAEYGLARVVEQLAYLNTGRRKAGEGLARVRAGGGRLDSSTGRDFTEFFAAVPAAELELALDVLSDMVFYPAYRGPEFTAVKKALIDKASRELREPEARAGAALDSALYPDHPYGRPGPGEALAEMPLRLPLAFFERYYRPDNCLLVVAGGFEPAPALELVERHLGRAAKPGTALTAWRPETPAAPAGPWVRLLGGGRGPETGVRLAFPGPAAGGRDSQTAELLARLLAGRLKREAATGWTVEYRGLAQTGSFFMETETGRPAEAVAELGTALAGLTGEAPAASDLDRAREELKLAGLLARDGPFDRAVLLSDFDLYWGDWRVGELYPEWLDRQGPAEVLALARRCFRPENLVLAAVLPGEPEADQLEAQTGELTGLISAWPRPPEAMDTERPGPETEPEGRVAVTLPSGSRLILKPEPGRSLVRISAGLAGPLEAEAAFQPGAARALVRAWPAGAGPRLELRSSFRPEAVFLHGRFPAADLAAGLEGFWKHLTAPDFARAAIPAAAESGREDRLAWSLTRPYLFGRLSPYGRPEPDREPAGFGPDDLQAYHRSLMRPENLVLVVSGAFDPEALTGTLAELAASWPASETRLEAPAGPPPLVDRVKISKTAPGPEARALLAFQAPALESPDRAPLRVLSDLLLAPDGLLRERPGPTPGLALDGGYRPRRGGGELVFGLTAAPDLLRKALDDLAGTLRELRARSWADEEAVEAAKRRSLGLETLAAASWPLGSEVLAAEVLAGREDDDFLKALAAVTGEDLKRAAELYLNPDRSVLTVVGPREALGVEPR